MVNARRKRGTEETRNTKVKAIVCTDAVPSDSMLASLRRCGCHATSTLHLSVHKDLRDLTRAVCMAGVSWPLEVSVVAPCLLVARVIAFVGKEHSALKSEASTGSNLIDPPLREVRLWQKQKQNTTMLRQNCTNRLKQTIDECNVLARIDSASCARLPKCPGIWEVEEDTIKAQAFRCKLGVVKLRRVNAVLNVGFKHGDLIPCVLNTRVTSNQDITIL
mmetsp:Transcript_118396/g.379572  ORF Transcript_118396/g.379572 Transcript_118396/m.379572 type:complete len:219 (+) Transcript_118396:1791-2447(+)